jgi:hypothetical protein
MGRRHSRRGGLLVAGQKSQKGSVATDGHGFTRIASRRVTPALGGFSGEKTKVVSRQESVGSRQRRKGGEAGSRTPC